MTREQLTELITFAKVMKLEKESLQEVLLQKEVAELKPNYMDEYIEFQLNLHLDLQEW